MNKIEKHPILDIPDNGKVRFKYNNVIVEGDRGFTIAAALHQAGFPVHSHSISGQNRSLACGIGKCGACEMVVDGKVKRICITKVDDVREVTELPGENFLATDDGHKIGSGKDTIYKTTVAIVGAGPAGLACREKLNALGIPNMVIDSNDKIGGQFLMQTHQFFFFEKEKRFGGMRGFDIAAKLAGHSMEGILLNSSVWDILDGKRLAVKNTVTDEIFYVDAEAIVVAAGAVPFMPAFENDDVPGVYTAAVVQKMMNSELTLLGKNVLTIGAGNIGYLTSYQLMQGGANVKAIIEAMPREGGFPVQANRVRRLGIPIFTSHILLKAIPNADRTGVIGAVIAECENFKIVAGTEKVIDGIDCINICTGLIPDNQLITKGKEVFGSRCLGAGDSIRIGEGTSAVLRGTQAAYDVAQELGFRVNYDEYLAISKEYIDSQQHPIRIKQEAEHPNDTKRIEKPFVIMDCLYGFACNPCEFACKYDAITKTSTNVTPTIDYAKCIGCLECIYQCPGLAIFGYHVKKNWCFLPIEFDVTEGTEVFLVDNNGEKIGNGLIEKVQMRPNKTNVARVRALDIIDNDLMNVRGFIEKDRYPQPITFNKATESKASNYICHCDDVDINYIMKEVGKRTSISVDEIKHITRLGMGACRGKRCIPRLRLKLRECGVELIGDATPRGPMSNQISLKELYPKAIRPEIITSYAGKLKRVETEVLIAGGGIGGSSLFRYFTEAGKMTTLVNHERGSSWRNIAGGRPAFSLPEISDIARHNYELFKNIQKRYDINLYDTQYVSFAHDDKTYKALEASRAWSDAYMVDKKDFKMKISPLFNGDLNDYQSALISRNCWQATPGRVVDHLRGIGIEGGGVMMEGCQLIHVDKIGHKYKALIRTNDHSYIEYTVDHFVNALGSNAEKFAEMLGINTGLYPVKHQAFITRRLPMLGIDGNPLDMLIDRRNYKGFSAVYGQQLKETGQIIACASPAVDAQEANKSLQTTTKEFLEISSELFCSWIPELASAGFQAIWSGYYTEPRYIIDPELGLFVGLRGHGFMLGQYLAKIYVDSLLGRNVPNYTNRLKLSGDGLSETAFK